LITMFSTCGNLYQPNCLRPVIDESVVSSDTRNIDCNWRKKFYHHAIIVCESTHQHGASTQRSCLEYQSAPWNISRPSVSRIGMPDLVCCKEHCTPKATHRIKDHISNPNTPPSRTGQLRRSLTLANAVAPAGIFDSLKIYAKCSFQSGKISCDLSFFADLLTWWFV
jgi:hypothetical protein